MRLLYFTNRDLASNLMLNHLLPVLHPYIQHIFISDKVGRAQPDAPQALQDLKFYEQTLPNAFIFPQLDQATEPATGRYLSFEGLAKRYGIPIQSWNAVNSPESLAYVRELQPDLVLSVRYGRIFDQAFVQIPRQGVVNFHSGLLPNYRGVLAVFRALNNGDSHVHGTLHYIDDKTIDTGGIIGFSSLEVNPQRSLLWHILQLYPSSAAWVAEQVVQLLQGKHLPTVAQDERLSAYYTFPTTAELAEFQAKGWSIVDAADYAVWLRQYL